MKISNSKKELARIISENGGWREMAKFSAQDKDGDVYHFATKPTINAGHEAWHHKGCIGEGEFTAETLPNWRQTILSREEYFHLYPAPDSDGWIEWKGGAANPVEFGVLVDVKLANGEVLNRVSANSGAEWRHCWGDTNIIAYRLHKLGQAKPEFCEPVMRTIPEPEAKPTIEHLAADYRNAKECAERKRQEADDAKADADEKLRVLELAGEAIGLLVSPITAKQEPELVITDWRDLRVGDEIEVFNFERPGYESRRKQELMSGPCIVMQSEGGNVRIELKKKLPTNGSYWNATGVDACDFKFIRRP